MNTRRRQILIAIALIVGMAGKAHAQGEEATIGDALRRAAAEHRSVHIIYVHGIRQNLPGSSLQLRQSVCKYLGLTSCKDPGAPGKREYAEYGGFAVDSRRPPLTYMGKPVWQNDEEWHASAPFVVHYVIKGNAGPSMVVDEFNWWPITLSLKCREIVAREARAAGSINSLIDFCSQPTQRFEQTRHYESYNWIPRDQAGKLKKIRPQSALLNRLLKNSILDWGISDAMMAVGSANSIFMESMRQLILKSVRFREDGTESDDWRQQETSGRTIDREFFMVSHSLGSYLVFSILNSDASGALRAGARPVEDGSGAATEDAAVRYVLERTPQAYFFANQIPIIELAELQRSNEGESLRNSAPEGAQDDEVPLMNGWRSLRESFNKQLSGEQSTPGVPRVVAWSDPSDMLSWHLPSDHQLFENQDVFNSWWHWIIANPEKAHDGYDSNKKVIRAMFGPRKEVVAVVGGNP